MLDKIQQNLESAKVRLEVEPFTVPVSFAKAEITEALKELSTFIESNGWQDISTIGSARDSRVFITDGECVCSAFIAYDGTDDTPSYCVDDLDEYEGYLPIKPTHWQPLPAIKSIKDMI